MSSFVAFRAAAASLRVSKPLVRTCVRQQVRTFQGTACCLKKKKDELPELTEKGTFVKKSKKEAITKIMNERITHKYVRIAADARNGEVGRGGGLSEPIRLKEILETLNRKEFDVLLVSDSPDPIVKILSKKEEYEKKKAAKKAGKDGTDLEKEVQISWAAAPSDTQHKLDKSREYLEKGYRVHFIFMHKKGQPIPSKQGMADRVQAIVDSFADIATEYRPRDHRFSMAACFVKGTAPPAPPPPPAPEPTDKKLYPSKYVLRQQKQQEEAANQC